MIIGWKEGDVLVIKMLD